MGEPEKGVDLSGVRRLFDDRTSNLMSAGVVAVFLLFLTVNTLDIVANNTYVRGIVDGDTTWDVSFEEEVLSYNEVVIVGDGDNVVVEFDVLPTALQDGYRVGGVIVTVSYGETSQVPGDPADSVAASLVQNSYPAEWSDENNTLSGASNDASDIVLDLRTYPDYDGNTRNATGYNALQVLEPWVMDGHGLGLLEVNIEVDTASLPLTNDGNEEVTVTLDVITFRAFAVQ